MALGVNFSEVDEAKEFTDRPGAGVYVCTIVKAENVPEKQYIKAYLDIAVGDYLGYGKSIEDRTGQDWGYIPCYFSYKPTALGMTKRNVRLVAESSDYKGNIFDEFSDTEGKVLEGKYIGIVIGEQEYEKQDGTVGKLFKLPKLVLAQDAMDKPESFKVPELEKLAVKPAETQLGSFDTPF